MVGIHHWREGQVHYGWLRLEFDRKTEVVTLIEYAYDSTPLLPIRAGQKSQ